MKVTTSCRACLRTIHVPLDLFETRQGATCRDAGLRCPDRAVTRA